MIQVNVCINFTEAIYLENTKTILLCDLSLTCYHSREWLFKALSSRLNEFSKGELTDYRRWFSLEVSGGYSTAFGVRCNAFA